MKESDNKLNIVLKEIFRLEKKTDKRFDGLEGGITMLEKRLASHERKTEQNFDILRGDFRQLQSAVDTYAKKADTYFQEMVMLAHKVNRLERWILQLAEKANIHLKS